MRGDTQTAPSDFRNLDRVEQAQPEWRVSVPDDGSSGDAGITNIYEVIRLWGDDYAEILSEEELSGGDWSSEHPYAARRGGSL